MEITKEQFFKIFPTLTKELGDKYLPYINTAMREFEINTKLRAAAFLAQIGHETGVFRWMREIWGPTEAQKRYEYPNKKAIELGNIQEGDGKKYRGRGAIQLTGRANYQKYSELLGLDLEVNPEQASDPEVAFKIAACFWKTHGLNELADVGNFLLITKRINGGTKGLTERRKYYTAALTEL